MVNMFNNNSSLKQKTVSGILWNFLETILRRGASGITTLVLAWFLTPEDFGLVRL